MKRVNVTTLVSIIFMYQQVFSSSYRSSTVICTYNLIIFHLLKNDTLFIHLYCTYSKFGHVVAYVRAAGNGRSIASLAFSPPVLTLKKWGEKKKKIEKNGVRY